MNQIKNIFILFISLLLANNGLSKNLSNNFSEKKTVVVHAQNQHSAISSFVENSFPNDDFDLEEDSDDSDDDDYLHIITSKNIIVFDELTNTHLDSYFHSIQSVKRFILYCSLKLYC